MNRLIKSWLMRFGYFFIDDLQAGGHCGLCGGYDKSAVVEKVWPWTICTKCEECYK